MIVYFPLFIIVAITAFFWGSSLSFFPVPWPDDSAFFLTGLDFVKWPPLYRMHAQAAFVPTYDIANFNTMPFLPFLMGISHALGITGSHGIRIWGMLAFALWGFLLFLWMQKRGLKLWLNGLITLCALFSPSIRWGAMVVRPEIWEGLFWLLILLELDGFFKKPCAWRLPLFLAGSAYVHFQAIVWVLPTAVGLFFLERRKIWGVIWRTAILLSPWFFYVSIHWNVFWIQMATQFGRLAIPNDYIKDAYGFFHNLFFSLGNPIPLPKFFNLGKVITWAVLVISFVANLWASLKVRESRPVRLAAGIALITTFQLWATKPETWFTVLIHLSFWPIIVLTQGKKIGVIPALTALLLILEIGVAVVQFKKTDQNYTWDQYTAWTQCIEKNLGTRKSVWQPHWPDALVALATHSPERDYTRAVDFQGITPLIENYVQKVEAILHNHLFVPTDALVSENYEGPARPQDLFFLTEYPWMPFKKYSVLELGHNWEMKICHRGPFWAALSLKKQNEIQKWVQ